MITSQFHPLDEVQQFGCTIHGLAYGTINQAVFEVDGVPFPLPSGYNIGERTLQIVRHPGAGPVPLAPEVMQAEREAGRVWQNFALLQYTGGGELIFGQRVGGWIFIDSIGQRWLVRITYQPNAMPGSPYSLDLALVPFGYLDGAPMERVDLVLSCPDIQQITPGARIVRVVAVNSTGSRCILQLQPLEPANALPSGFLEITLSDDAGAPAGVLSVYRSQEATRGEWDTTHPATTNPRELLTFHNMLVAAELEGAVYPEGPDIPFFPVGGGTATMTVTGPVEIDQTSPLDAYSKGNVTVSCGRTGRLLTVAFDHADELVPFTFDTRYQFSGLQPDWSGEASGVITAFGDGEFINDNPWSSVEPPQVSVTRTVSERVESTITLRRGDVKVCDVTNVRSYSATLSATLAAYTEGWAWAAGYLGRGGGPGNFAFAERVNTAAASAPTNAMAERGGPWPATYPSAPAVVGGGGGMEYLSNFPLGTVERDADSLEFAFDVTYRFAADVERAVFDEITGFGTGAVVREIAIAFPHAELLGRGLERANGCAYDPIGHGVVVGADPSQLISFV